MIILSVNLILLKFQLYCYFATFANQSHRFDPISKPVITMECIIVIKIDGSSWVSKAFKKKNRTSIKVNFWISSNVDCIKVIESKSFNLVRTKDLNAFERRNNSNRWKLIHAPRMNSHFVVKAKCILMRLHYTGHIHISRKIWNIKMSKKIENCNEKDEVKQSFWSRKFIFSIVREVRTVKCLSLSR